MPERRQLPLQLDALDVLRELLPMLPEGATSGAVARARRLVAEADAQQFLATASGRPVPEPR